MVQVNQADASVNLPQFAVGHVSVHVVLEHHHVEDKRLGSRMPMQASVLLGVFDKALVDAFGEFEVKTHVCGRCGVGGVG